MTLAITITLLATFLWALNNHLDKILLCKISTTKTNLKTLLLFSSLVAGLILAPMWLIICDFKVKISLNSFLLTYLSAIIYILSTTFYFKVLEKNDVSIIAVMFQLTSVFTFIFGLIFFNETLTLNETIGALLIILSTIFITIDLNKKTKIKTLLLMIITCILDASYFFLFDLAMRNSTYNAVAFWYQIGLLLIGLFLISFDSYQKEFKYIIKRKGKKFITLNIINEFINLLANLLVNYANVVIPLALVNTLTGFQGIFVFVISVIGTIIAPKYFKENQKTNDLFQKILCTLLGIVGLMVLMK